MSGFGSDLLAGGRIAVVGAGTRPTDEADAPPGNGRAIAIAAARAGSAVACIDLDEAAAGQTVELIEADGGTALALQADAAEEDSIGAALNRAHAELGGLSGLVLNVGIALGSGLEGTPAEVWDKTFAVNVRSHFLGVRAVAPLLDEGGSVVFISSIAAGRAFSEIPAYDASKAAVEALTRHAAMELAPRGIRANAIEVGVIDTPLGRVSSSNRPAREGMKIPLGRKGTPWEIASAVLFFLSGAASYVTGQTLAVDGGLIVTR